MDLSMDIIAQHLTQYEIDQICGTESSPTLESVRLLHRFLTEMDPRYLYMGIPEDIERLHCDVEGITIISSGVPEKYDHIKPNCNMYFIRNDVDFGQFYNEVEDIFTYYNTWSQRLKDLCSSMASLQSLIDASDDIFPYPISLMDGAERTIAYSKNKTCNDLVWEYIQEGYIKTEYLVRDNVHSKDIAYNRVPQQMFTVASNRYVLIQPVIVHRRPVAYLSMMMEDAGTQHFSRATEHMMAELTRAIASRMEADEFYGSSMGLAIEFFLADLISRKQTDYDVIADRAEFFGQKIEAKRRVFCIPDSESDNNKERRLRRIREKVSALLPGVDNCSYQNNAVFIECERNKGEGFPEAQAAFTKWVEEEHLVCGISMSCNSLYELPDYFEQARTAIRLGKVLHPGNSFYCYDMYIVQHSLELLDKQINIRSMLHPLVERMLAVYGEDHYMIDTLYTYLTCERNISKAAKLLHIHRNTLLYRVEQLTDKLHNNFSEPLQRRQVMYSLEIVEYIRKFKQERILPAAEKNDK